MTVLHIDRQAVVLPENFSISAKIENPTFTKKGKYTFDITLSLLDPINARIYNHLNRKNRKGYVPQNRSVILISDNLVILKGTEVILDFSESEVKIQLVSGNSELNFQIKGDDLSVRSLDLGEADLSGFHRPGQINAWFAYDNLQKSYPNRDFQLFPFIIGSEDGEIANNYSLIHSYPGAYISGNQDISKDIYPWLHPIYSNSIPQPYFCFLIKRVLQSLGYTMSYNALEHHSQFSQACLLNGYQTAKYAKMLPDWTVSEFLSKIEKMFDCTFIVDDYSNTVEVRFNYEALVSEQSGGFGKVVELNVLHKFKQEIDTDNRQSIHVSNIDYNLDSVGSHKFARIPDRVFRENPEYVRFRFESELFAMISDNTDENRFGKIFTDGYYNFIAYKQSDPDRVCAFHAHYFAPLYNNATTTEIDESFDIIPAPMTYRSIGVTWGIRPALGHSTFWVQMPIAVDADAALNADPNSFPASEDLHIPLNIQSYIDGEIEEDPVPSKIRLVIYRGLMTPPLNIYDPNQSKKAKYPVTYVESIAEYMPEQGAISYIGPLGLEPFRFSTFENEIYNKSKGIDTTRTSKFTFQYKGLPDVRSIFIIDNKQYLCSSIEMSIKSEGIDPIYTGYFHPLG